MKTLLGGVRVLDLTTVLAGPFAAYQMALLGADVIKVEIPVGGDSARDFGDDEELRTHGMGASFLAQNAGKRSITVDLKTSEGREVFERLLRSADVLVENMRPGVLSRLGFPWEVIHGLNPQLIYCALTGYGQDGPLADRAAYDQIIQGLSGMVDVTGYPESGPVRVGFPVCDTLGGLSAALAVSAALVRRERDPDSVGSRLDVSMLDTAITAMAWAVSEYLISGTEARRRGNDNASSSPSGMFLCKDGPLVIATNTQRQFESLCKVLRREDLLSDPRFSSRLERKRNRAVLTEEIESVLLRETAESWEIALGRESVPAGRVLSVADALVQEQVRVRGLLHEVEVEIPDGRTVTVVGSGTQVDGVALAPTRRPPRLGEHTVELLQELGYSSGEIGELIEQRAV